jgi:hypothetical protein
MVKHDQAQATCRQLTLSELNTNESLPRARRKKSGSAAVGNATSVSPKAEFDILYIRRLVAGNPNTPVKVLGRLAADVYSVIRRRVAENPRTPPDVLCFLARDLDLNVRLAVADNLHTPTDALLLLVKDENADVRYDLADNPHLPREILVSLAKDENPYVRCRALKTLQMVSSNAS